MIVLTSLLSFMKTKTQIKNLCIPKEWRFAYIDSQSWLYCFQKRQGTMYAAVFVNDHDIDTGDYIKMLDRTVTRDPNILNYST